VHGAAGYEGRDKSEDGAARRGTRGSDARRAEVQPATCSTGSRAEAAGGRAETTAAGGARRDGVEWRTRGEVAYELAAGAAAVRAWGQTRPPPDSFFWLRHDRSRRAGVEDCRRGRKKWKGCCAGPRIGC
jgi:hypothetical protein